MTREPNHFQSHYVRINCDGLRPPARRRCQSFLDTNTFATSQHEARRKVRRDLSAIGWAATALGSNFCPDCRDQAKNLIALSENC